MLILWVWPHGALGILADVILEIIILFWILLNGAFSLAFDKVVIFLTVHAIYQTGCSMTVMFLSDLLKDSTAEFALCVCLDFMTQYY